MRREPTTRLEVFGSYCPRNPRTLATEILDSKINLDSMMGPSPHESKEDSMEITVFKVNEEHERMMQQNKYLAQHKEQQAVINANETHQLENDLTDLREKLISVNLFAQSCEENKRKANETIAKERTGIVSLKAELAELKEHQEIMTKFHKDLMETIRELEPYEQIIQETLEMQSIWKSIDECLQRCDALMLTQSEIQRIISNKYNEMEQIRLSMAKRTNNAINSILGMTTALNNFERDLIHARNRSFYWSKILVNAKNAVIEDELEGNRMIEGIDVVYKTICAHNRIHPPYSIGSQNIEQKLEFIREELFALQTIYKESREEMERMEAAARHQKARHSTSNINFHK